ncbi:MAG TPA: choice-of-anchor R domain-containing protein [Candidatus Paceibacterota bacterium]|nr:choice-of-anchor R domain-containing protein [Candidatus Paceibacterota bacterium]HPT18058.1 choice-of-anchor R domain-containing protein [Candidatus Paceibacterota bacterium]
MKKDLLKYKRQKGAAMLIVVVFFLFISLVIVSGLVSPAIREVKSVSENLDSKKAYFLAESGVEDALYRLLTNKPLESSETITLDSNSATTAITTIGSNKKEIISIGDFSDYQRKVDISLSAGSGVSFSYGVQVGQGGIEMQGSSGVNGSVYANGPIKGGTSSFISGTAISANSPSLNADQANGDGVPGYNVSFANTNSTQDVAQSFQVENSAPLNKAQIYIKKVGSPSDATVKIVNNLNGVPGSTVYTKGTLLASNVTSSYGWIDISFATGPTLDVGTTYWIIIDTNTSSSKYYVIGASDGGYGNGIGKIGRLGSTWNNTSPSGLDYFFKIFLGGFTGSIVGTSGSKYNQLSIGTGGSGSAQAHTVNYTEATGLIYCQTGTGNNKSCTPQTDPVYIAMPISDANIEQWKDDATIGGTYTGSYTTPDYGTSTLGPKKITGDLNVGGSHILYITGTVWVEGNVSVLGNSRIVLDTSTYGNTSGIIVSDGRLNLAGSSQLNGTGEEDSYILFVTTSNCDASFCTKDAIDISGNAGSVVLNAQKGTLKFSGSARAKEATAYNMILEGSTVVDYDSGLANINFTSGPKGGWNIENWEEIK